MTNPRLRDQRGEISMVEEEQRATGPGSSYIMAAFTHLNPAGSRFSDGSYGVYYAALLAETCIQEVAYHRTMFLGHTSEPPQTLVFSQIQANLQGICYNLMGQNWPWLRSNDYEQCRNLGRQARTEVDFLNYESVRHPGHAAQAVFRPLALSKARHVRYVEMYWDGRRITHSSTVQSRFQAETD